MRVLVVEDDLEIRRAVGRRLRADGHGADGADDGGAAESFVRGYRYDVIVLDRMLPGGDALELRRSWRTFVSEILTPADEGDMRCAEYPLSGCPS